MERKFKVIEGGAKPRELWKRYFISAYVTDTRLMGVMGLYIRWKAVSDNPDEPPQEFHQFFYYESEEAGLEAYLPLWSDDRDEILMLEKQNIGGLGAQKIDLSLDEFRHVLDKCCSFNFKHNLPFPGDTSEYLDLIHDLEPLSPEEDERLLQKICTPIRSEYELINYFLMRNFGCDFEAAKLLTPDKNTDTLLPFDDIYTMYKNTINKAGEDLFICDSLIERGGQYRIIISEIKILGTKVRSARVTSTMNISTAEAALIISRPEYVTVYKLSDYLMDPASNVRPDLTLEFDTASDQYENGTLFFSFRKNNDHVDRKVFRLSGDVRGAYFLSTHGQFIVMAYDMASIRDIERDLYTNVGEGKMMLTNRYEFKEPVLYEFIQSGFSDFNDFVDAFRE